MGTSLKRGMEFVNKNRTVSHPTYTLSTLTSHFLIGSIQSNGTLELKMPNGYSLKCGGGVESVGMGK